jgi:hypothetical protein
MYDLPSLSGAARCVVDRDSIEGLSTPRLLDLTGKDLSLPSEPMRKSA